MFNVDTIYRLDGRVAIVTGGGRGLGEVFCRTFAEAGASVVVADIIEDNAQSVAKDLKKAGHRATALKVDVRRTASVQDMAVRALNGFGAGACSVNGAGLAVSSTDVADSSMTLISPSSQPIQMV